MLYSRCFHSYDFYFLFAEDEDDKKHENEDITIMTKAEFDEMVSVFTQMLHYDPETLVTSLSEIDSSLGLIYTSTIYFLSQFH